MPSPRIGRRVAEQQPDPEQLERLGIHEIPDDDASKPQQDLAPEVIQQREIEKAQLVAMVRAQSPRRATEPTVTDETTFEPKTTSEIEAALAEAKDALAAVDIEIGEVERAVSEENAKLAAAVREVQERHQGKLTELAAKKARAAEEAARQAARLAAAELAERAALVTHQAEQAAAQLVADQAEKDAALRERLEPLIASARQHLAGVKRFDEAYGATLRALAFGSAPLSWPPAQREECVRVSDAARKLVRSLTTMLEGRPRLIGEATRMIAEGAQQRAEWAQALVQLEFELSHNVTADYYMAELLMLNKQLADVQPEADQLVPPMPPGRPDAFIEARRRHPIKADDVVQIIADGAEGGAA